MRKFYSGMNRISEQIAKVVKWIVLLLVITICYDVFARYLFNAPTVWSYTLSYMLGAIFSALGLAYVYSIGGNVRVDIIYTNLSLRKRQIIDLFFTLVFFFPLYGFLAFYIGRNTWNAWVIKEYDINSIWYPVIWPYMTLVTIGFVILLVQGVATFIRDVRNLAKGGAEPW